MSDAPRPFVLTLAERGLVDQLAEKMGQKPEDYIAVDVQVQQGAAAQVQIVPGPSGAPIEMAVVPLFVMLPLANMQAPRLLLPGQSTPDPLSGMIPLLHARLVLPRQRFKPEVLQSIEAAHNQANAAPPLPSLRRGKPAEGK